jgi:hypothetical protein
MSDTKELIERLRDAAWAGPIPCPVCDEAADAIGHMHTAYSHSQQQFLDATATIARLTAERDAARGLVGQALELCAGVAEQQAMTDDSWRIEAAAIRAAMQGEGK